MKTILSVIAMFLTLFSNAQTKLVPTKNVVDKKWIKNQEYQMTWYALKDTARFEIGKVTTRISNDNKENYSDNSGKPETDRYALAGHYYRKCAGFKTSLSFFL